MPGPDGGDRSYADKRKEIIGKAISAWNKRRNPGATGPAWAPRRPQAGRLQTRPDPASLTSGSPVPGSPVPETTTPQAPAGGVGGPDRPVTTKPFASSTAELPAQDPATPGSPAADPSSVRTEPDGPDAAQEAPTQPVPAAAHLIPANSTGPDTRPGSGENVTHTEDPADSDAEKSPATPSRKPSGGVGINSATVVIGKDSLPDFSDLPALEDTELDDSGVDAPEAATPAAATPEADAPQVPAPVTPTPVKRPRGGGSIDGPTVAISSDALAQIAAATAAEAEAAGDTPVVAATDTPDAEAEKTAEPETATESEATAAP
ncbi:MAG TPA: hypothetical protein PKC61_03460, partial [Gordonia sp. (in: high G+C Gram-positive bacteria)]|nr:hypothetical protein [Gordonia sp. (in: high G+C Gram-positive bacteria)]